MFGFLASSSVNAQIPFYTDDADSTAKGKFHLEFFKRARLATEIVPSGNKTEHFKFHLKLWPD